MAAHPSPVTQLNNLLQARREVDAISWVNEDSGPQNHKTWTITCKYKGQVIGVGKSANKVPAKEEAARQALTYFSGGQA